MNSTGLARTSSKAPCLRVQPAYLGGALEGVPVDGERVVADLLDVADDPDGVFGVGVEDALLDRVLPRVPELPPLHLLLRGLAVPENQHDHSLDGRVLQRRHVGVGHVLCGEGRKESNDGRS